MAASTFSTSPARELAPGRLPHGVPGVHLRRRRTCRHHRHRPGGIERPGQRRLIGRDPPALHLGVGGPALAAGDESPALVGKALGRQADAVAAPVERLGQPQAAGHGAGARHQAHPVHEPVGAGLADHLRGHRVDQHQPDHLFRIADRELAHVEPRHRMAHQHIGARLARGRHQSFKVAGDRIAVARPRTRVGEAHARPVVGAGPQPPRGQLRLQGGEVGGPAERAGLHPDHRPGVARPLADNAHPPALADVDEGPSHRTGPADRLSGQGDGGEGGGQRQHGEKEETHASSLVRFRRPREGHERGRELLGISGPERVPPPLTAPGS